MFEFGERHPVRRPSLTPMIDVVFLLLVFFMLAAQFGADRAVPVAAAAGGEGTYEGAPRLVGVEAAGLTLNGRPVAAEALVAELGALMPAPDALVVLRPAPGVALGQTMQVIDLLRAGGITRLVLAEPAP